MAIADGQFFELQIISCDNKLITDEIPSGAYCCMPPCEIDWCTVAC